MNNPSFRAKERVFVVDNGSVPFVVELSSLVGKGVARILRKIKPQGHIDNRNVRHLKTWTEEWRKVPYQLARIGIDPREKSGGLWQACFGDKWPGTSVLLALDTEQTRFLVVGSDIYEFSVEKNDKIVDFVSIMGNSGVAYPYAVGKLNTYLTVERTWLPNHMVAEGQDPYYVMYNTDLKTGARIKNLRIQRSLARKFKTMHNMSNVRVWHTRCDDDCITQFKSDKKN